LEEIMSTHSPTRGLAPIVAGILAAAVLGGCVAGPGVAPPREPVPPIGRLTSGNGAVRLSDAPTISTDGRFVIFESDATNLVPGTDANGAVTDVFQLDRLTTTTTRLTNGNALSGGASISRNGQWITFESDATDLVPGPDTFNNRDIFLYERATQITTRVTTQVTGYSDAASVDNNGNVAFQSGSDTLDPADTDSDPDIYVWNRATGVFTCITAAANGRSGEPEISGDGSTVVFSSEATDLTPGVDLNGAVTDIFAWTAAGMTRITNPVGSSGQGSGGTSISTDGRFIAFDSATANLVAGTDPNGTGFDVFLHDRLTATTTRITSGVAQSGLPIISGNGDWVGLLSESTDLTPGPDANGAGLDNFLWKRSTGAFRRLTNGSNTLPIDATGDNGDRISPTASSDDGLVVIYTSTATDLLPIADPNGQVMDLFISTL